MYCKAHCQQNARVLCPDCGALLEYAKRRLAICVFGNAKPTCANCAVHCYSAEMRKRIRLVMRWAGPRMLLTHPLRGILHLLDGRRPAPNLPAKSPK